MVIHAQRQLIHNNHEYDIYRQQHPKAVAVSVKVEVMIDKHEIKQKW